MQEKNSPEYWERRVANNTWKTYNSLEDKNIELLDFYTDASKAVKEELYDLAEKDSKDGVLTLSEMHKQNRLERLNERYEQIALGLGKETEKAAVRNMQGGFKEVYQNTSAKMGNEDFAMPNKELMEKLINEPWRGDNFSGRLWGNQKKLSTGLNDLLLTGLQQGKTVTEIAIQLHNFMGTGFNNAHRLVRTETMHYLNSATLQSYKDCGVKYVQVWAAQDERTCKVCGSYHGEVYPIDKCPILPFHANCRCTILPVTDPVKITELDAGNEGKSKLESLKISIPLNVYKASGMTKETKTEIDTAIKRLESEYTIHLDRIEGERAGKSDIFITGGFIDDDGVLKHSLVFNYDINYGKVEKRMEVLYNYGEMAGKSYEDYIAHEMAHIIPFQNCISSEDYRKMNTQLRGEFVSGLSGYADKYKDGRESLAEAFVRYRNDEEIPKKSMQLIKKYIEPWRR